ncbi:hypothetical protein GS464_29560 [Rhodococcus hoagii]|nr:hypothetical protein [Prescottella equi]
MAVPSDEIAGWAIFYLPIEPNDPAPFYLVPRREHVVSIRDYIYRGDHRWAMKKVNRLKIEPEWCLFWNQQNVVGG